MHAVRSDRRTSIAGPDPRRPARLRLVRPLSGRRVLLARRDRSERRVRVEPATDAPSTTAPTLTNLVPLATVALRRWPSTALAPARGHDDSVGTDTDTCRSLSHNLARDSVAIGWTRFDGLPGQWGYHGARGTRPLGITDSKTSTAPAVPPVGPARGDDRSGGQPRRHFSLAVAVS